MMNDIEAMQSTTDRPRELVIRSGQDDAHGVLVSVTDCGVGISAEDAGRLFNPFSPPNPAAWAWDSRSAVRSWKPTMAGCRPRQTYPRRHVSVHPAGERRHCVVSLRPEAVQRTAAPSARSAPRKARERGSS